MPPKTPLQAMISGRPAKLSATAEQNLARQILLDKKNATCTFKVKPPVQVDLDTIRTEADLFTCVLHLNEKPWITPQHLGFFVRRVAQYKGFSLGRPRPQPPHSRN